MVKAPVLVHAQLAKFSWFQSLISTIYDQNWHVCLTTAPFLVDNSTISCKMYCSWVEMYVLGSKSFLGCITLLLGYWLPNFTHKILVLWKTSIKRCEFGQNEFWFFLILYQFWSTCHLYEEKSHPVEFLALNSGLKCPALLTIQIIFM